MVRGVEAASCHARRALSALLLRRRTLSLSSTTPTSLCVAGHQGSFCVRVQALHTSWRAQQGDPACATSAAVGNVNAGREQTEASPGAQHGAVDVAGSTKDQLAREVERLEKEYHRVQAEAALLSRELQHAAADEARQQKKNSAPDHDSASAFANAADNTNTMPAADSMTFMKVQESVANDDKKSIEQTDAPVTAVDESQKVSGDNEEDGASSETEWPEPTLSDLDRSIPQVDCVFIANLLRSRNAQRERFLQQKAELQNKVDTLTQATMKTVFDQKRHRTVGGLPFARDFVQSRIQQLKAIAARTVDGEGTSLVATNAADVEEGSLAPVQAAPEVLAQLTNEERDMLNSLRPEYDDGFILLDCRTVNEVTSWGIIEGAKVLPAHELFDAFHATPDDFLRDYGFAKPRPDQTIICYCQYGPRSLMAAQILSWMGYLKVLHFRDGYYEWGKQYNLLLRTWMEHDKSSGNELRRLAAFQAGLELQREIAPEFNALPMQEAAQYQIDITRSPGTMRIGEGLRAEAYAQLAKLIKEPIALPESTNTTISSNKTGGGVSLGADHMEDKSPKQQQLLAFLAQATGLDMSEEMTRAEEVGRDEISIAQAAAVTAVDSISALDRRKPR